MSTDGRWVCLMYHDVLPITSAAGGGAERFAVPLSAFEQMLDIIAAEGYQGCSMAAALRGDAARPVAITFDDGALSQFDHAFPALKRHDMTATFFVTTDWVGKPGFMTWEHLRELVSSGMSVQSHTKSHSFLSELDAKSLKSELSESKAALDWHLSQQTTELSLPGGNAPRRALRPLLWEVGYRVVAGSRWGSNDRKERLDKRFVHRCTVRGTLTEKNAVRVLDGDRRLAFSQYSREVVLNSIRGLLGASRYARYRRRLLDTL